MLQVLDVGEVDEIYFLELEGAGFHFLVLENQHAALVLELSVHSLQHGLH